MTYELAAGYTTEDPRLDRLPSQNERRLELYPAERLLQLLAADAASVRARRWRRGPLLDQGNEGACVGFSGTNFLRASPVRNRNVGGVRDVRDQYARELYRACQRIDEWPGEDYEGTSVDALGKTLLQRGLVRSYVWVTNGASELAQVLQVQPAVMGTWWWTGMDEAGRNDTGIALPTGSRRGGHAWLVDGFLPRATVGGRTDAWFRGYNSWGPWGAATGPRRRRVGTFWVPIDAMNALLSDQGEAMVPAEVRV